jgi:hypothetical protein
MYYITVHHAWDRRKMYAKFWWGNLKEVDHLEDQSVEITQPLIRWVSRAVSSGSKREAHHAPPSSAKVKNAWIYTSTSPICFDGVHTRITLPLLKK